MPPVGAAIGGLISGIGGISIFGSTVVGSIVGSLARVAAGVGLSYVAKALAGKSEEGTDAGRRSVPSGVQVDAAAGDSLPRSFIVGKWATAGRIVFLRNFGDSGKTPNAFLVQVIRISDLPVESLQNVYINGVQVTYGSGTLIDRGYPIPQYKKDGKDHLWIRFYDGTQTTADSFLQNKFNSGGRNWTSNHVGRGISYAIVTSRWNPKLFDKRPEALFVVNGAKLYDITKDSTAGGSGTQRWNNPATWAHTHNPMVIIYNLMRGIFYNSEWVYGLQTVSAAQLPFSSWAAAINECALTVTNKDTSTNAQYRAGAEIAFDTEVGLEIQEFLKSCNGRIADAGGVYKPKVGAAGSAIASFTDDALLMTDEQAFNMFPSLDDTVNGVDATYVSPGDGWTEKAAPPRRSSTYRDADGGRLGIADVSYNHVWDKQQVQRLMQSILLESRRFRRHVLVLPPELYLTEPLDFVEWDSDLNGYTSKLFRVDSKVDRANGDQILGLQEVDPNDYSWTAATDETLVSTGVQIIDTPAPQAPASYGVSAVVITGDGGATIAALRFVWDASAVDDVSIVKFEVRKVGGAVIARDETTFPETGTYDMSKNIPGQTSLEARILFDNPTSSRDFDPSPWMPVTSSDVRLGINQLATSLQTLINDSGASGDVIFEKVTNPGSAFQTLFRLTVYGTGANPPSAGMYVFVDSGGRPGFIADADRFYLGPLSGLVNNAEAPFIIEGGVVKLRRSNIQQLQAEQLAANSITADKIKVNTIKAENIKGGSLVISRTATQGKSSNTDIGDAPNVFLKIDKPLKDGCVIVSATFGWELARNNKTLTIGIVRKSSQNASNFTTVCQWTAIPLGGSGVETLTGIDTPGKGTWWYFVRVLKSEGQEGFIKKKPKIKMVGIVMVN